MNNSKYALDTIDFMCAVHRNLIDGAILKMFYSSLYQSLPYSNKAVIYSRMYKNWLFFHWLKVWYLDLPSNDKIQHFLDKY